MRQFTALMLKNWKLYKRGIVGSALEILVPVAFILLVLLIHIKIPPTQVDAQSFVNNT